MRSKFKWIFTLILALTMQFSFAQEKTVTGVVSDATGTLPGANVVVKGTTRGTQTDVDGKYSISAKAGEVLVFSFVGMTDVSMTVGASNTISVKLEQGVQLIEVIVEGYRNTTKTATVVAQSTVTSKTIENRPNASFLQTLQGQVAGLSIATGSGQPGARSTVIIRGASSITGNTDPLYVIDGIPTNGDNFRSLNPDDIESATVLKDAAATAIYGNRGTNGVIVITTKRGGNEDGKMTVRYAVSTGITQLQRAKYSFADSRQLLTLERAFGVGRGNNNPATGAPFTDAEINAFQTNTDWVDYFFRDATSSTHQLSIENPGKYLNSYSSASYTDQQGILTTTGLKRFSLRNNLSATSANGKFHMNNSLFLGFSKNNEATSLGTGAINRNYVLGATLSAPYIDPSEYTSSQALLDLYNEDGTLLYTPLFLVDKLNTYVNNTDELRILGSVDLSYELFKGFTARSRTSIDLVETRFTQSEDPLSFNALLFVEDGAEFGGFEDVNQRRDYRFSQLWQAAYTHVFAEKHTVSLFGNMEYNFSQSNINNIRQNGLNPATFVPGTGSGYLDDIEAHDFYGSQVGVNKAKFNLISYFATLDYDFNDKYGVVGTFRYDGSSRFIGDLKWGSFWSVGGRWNINNESFLKDNNFVDVLKLRASFGSTGNQRVIDGTEWAGLNPPLNRDTYGIADAVYSGQPGNTFSLGYDLLQWETTEQADLGLDFEFMKHRLRGAVDLYKKRTFDLFNVDNIPAITGQINLSRNTDTEVHNRGVEVELAYDLLRNADWKFTLRGNVAYNEQHVENVPNGEQGSGNIVTRENGLIYEYNLIPYVGVNPETGNAWFMAADGTLTETPNPDTDARPMGINDVPVIQGGFGFDLDYRGFFATTNFTFTERSYRLDFDLEGLYDPGSLGQFVVSDDLLNAWTPENPNTNVPSLNATNLDIATDNSDRFLRDASYVRMRYAQVGYKFPKKTLEKTFMTGLTFYVQGENLYTWTKWEGFDAESNRASDQAQYPTPKIISFGMDLRF
jgi:TonB-linked SusC/RagA family outer membrane protein